MIHNIRKDAHGNLKPVSPLTVAADIKSQMTIVATKDLMPHPPEAPKE